MKMSIALGFAFVVGMVGMMGGCAAPSSEPSPPPQKKEASSATSASSATEPNDPAPSTADKSSAACVTKDSKANEQGVGAYCDKTTKCTSGLCTADFDEAGSATFCTKLCSADADCGTGAFCYHDPRGSACVLTACK
jgi:hypothetical protein